MFYNNPIGLSRCLFGNSHLRATIDLNSHLKVFLERTSSYLILSESQFINDYTLYPFYRAFLDENERVKILNSMLSSSGQDIHTRVGINASRLKRGRVPKYCVLCYLEDVEKFGEAFWHRMHQIPGLDVCCAHNVSLETYQPKLNQLGHGYYLPPPDKLDSKVIRTNNCDTLLYISKKGADILLNKSFDLNKVNYYDHVISLGYYKGKQIDQSDILNKFKSFYGSKTLTRLSHHIGNELGWINEIIRRPSHIFNPIRHILFSKFCDELPLKLYPDSNPFKKGPWICYNKASDHYLKEVVNNLKIHTDNKSKRQIGVFTCDCGMVYSMSFIKTHNGSFKKYVRIKSFGEKWTLRLQTEVLSGKSLREIARILGTDAKTVAQKSKTLASKERSQIATRQNLKDQKKQWSNFFKKDGSKTIKEAREKMPAIYSLLYRHAKEWLLAFNASRRKTQSNQGILRLDWDDCDQVILAKLQDAITLLHKSGFKGRLTKSLLAKVVGHESQLMNSNINKLPRSSDFLYQKIESKDEFQKRRIRIAINELKQNNKPVKRWTVIKQSRLRSSLKSSIIQYTNKMLKQYG